LFSNRNNFWEKIFLTRAARSFCPLATKQSIATLNGEKNFQFSHPFRRLFWNELHTQNILITRHGTYVLVTIERVSAEFSNTRTTRCSPLQRAKLAYFWKSVDTPHHSQDRSFWLGLVAGAAQ